MRQSEAINARCGAYEGFSAAFFLVVIVLVVGLHFYFTPNRSLEDKAVILKVVAISAILLIVGSTLLGYIGGRNQYLGFQTMTQQLKAQGVTGADALNLLQYIYYGQGVNEGGSFNVTGAAALVVGDSKVSAPSRKKVDSELQ